MRSRDVFAIADGPRRVPRRPRRRYRAASVAAKAAAATTAAMGMAAAMGAGLASCSSYSSSSVQVVSSFAFHRPAVDRRARFRATTSRASTTIDGHDEHDGPRAMTASIVRYLPLVEEEEEEGERGKEARTTMSVAELLTLLDGWGVRYPPDATRDRLEALASRLAATTREGRGRMVGAPGGTGPRRRIRRRPPPSMSSSSSSSSSTTTASAVGTAVDAVVVVDDDDDAVGRRRIRRRRAGTRVGDDGMGRRIRRRGRPTAIRDPYPTGDDDDRYYSNGLQIFVMGFVEAGRAVARLAADALVDAVGGMRGRDEDDDDDIVDAPYYRSPPPRRGRRAAARWRGIADVGVGVGVGGKGREGRRRPRRPRDRRGTVPPDRDVGQPRGDARGGMGMAAGPAGSPMPSRRVVRDGSEGVAQRKIYGLYHRSDDGGNRGTDRSTSSSNRVDLDREEGAEGRESRRDERRWKERLRRKFDVALGLESPPSSSSSSMAGTYYDSWRTQMEGMDDGRKEELRRRMNELDDSPVAVASRRNGELRRDAASSSSPYRNNRRARMRAKTTAFDQRSTSPRSIESPKSRLEEVPFWREGGSIASLLFENRPSSSPGAREDKHSMGKKTLEQLLLSPFGREHTVTSLFLYVSRSALTAFGILCRWAGVRGAIPQPIVVTSMIATILSSRGGQRALSLALTLLVLRLVGEFIHGSLHGNEFWDDEYDFKSHDWKDKPQIQ